MSSVFKKFHYIFVFCGHKSIVSFIITIFSATGMISSIIFLFCLFWIFAFPSIVNLNCCTEVEKLIIFFFTILTFPVTNYYVFLINLYIRFVSRIATIKLQYCLKHRLFWLLYLFNFL